MLAIVTSHPIQYQAPLWRELARAGLRFEVWFLTPHAVASSFDREFGRAFAWDTNLLEGYPHRFLEIAPGWTLTSFNGIRLEHSWAEEFRARGITHVWLEGWRFRTLWEAARAAKSAGISVWMRGENNDLAPERWSRRIWKKPLLRWLFSHVDHFLCIGTANRRFYLHHRVPPERLHAAPYAVDNDFFAAEAARLGPERTSLRAAWGIAPEAKCVLFCGKLIPKKRPLDLIAAVALLPSAERKALHLLFVGTGELSAEVRGRLAESSAPASTLAGFLNQSEIPRAFAAADSLVLPSQFGETWGLVVNEALASDVPVLVSDQCGCAEDLAAPLGAAHVFPSGNTAILADHLRQVLAHPPERAAMRSLIARHAPRQTATTAKALLEFTSNPAQPSSP